MGRRLGFIGGGQMARALAAGFIYSGKASPADILASDISDDARRAFEAQTRASTTVSNLAVLGRSEAIILAVKPQVLPGIADELRSAVTSDHIIVSIAAGVSLSHLADWFGNDKRLVRVMPNTPCLVGASASALSVGGAAAEDDCHYVEELFGSVGLVFRLPEPLLDAVTGLSGSGPAYVFTVIDALSDGGVRAGLPRQVATKLAAQTVFGAAKMVLETGKHPAELKDMVASPGGTTIAGLAVLEQRALRGALIDAVTAATLRSKELGRLTSTDSHGASSQ